MNNCITNYAKLLGLILFSLSSFCVLGSVDNIRFERVSDINGGLSQQSVISIFQDSKGYMWFGTQEGLNKYDGINFVSYLPKYNDPSTISSGWIYSITEDDNGNLWIGTNNGVNVLNRKTNKFTHYTANKKINSINDEDARVVHKDINGTIWVATRKGLNQYIASENRFKHHNFLNSGGKQSIEIYAIAEDITGALWLGTNNLGLIRFDPETEQTTIISEEFITDDGAKRIDIRSLYIDEKQLLWIGTKELGLFKLDLNKPKTEFVKDSIVLVDDFFDRGIMAIAKDQQQNLWVATSKGPMYKKAGQAYFTELSEQNGVNGELAKAEVWTVYSDFSGVFWVGTFNGLHKWNTRTTQFDRFYKDAGPGKSLSSNNSTAIINDQNNLIYIGSQSGVDFLDPKNGSVTTLPIKTDTQYGLREERVMSMAFVNEHEIWFGYRVSGASRYNPITKEFAHYNSVPNDNTTLATPSVASILATQNGDVWFSTFRGGISRYNRDTDNFTTFQHDPSDISTLSSNRVLNLYETNDGSLWVGTWDGGLNIFVPSTGTAFRVKHDEKDENSIGGDRILSVLEDSFGNIWVGTHGSGVNIMTAKNKESGKIVFEKLDTENGMPSNVIYGLLEDQDGFIWASTNKGIVKINRDTREIDIYRESQGIQADEFNSGAYHKDAEGYLYFGGLNGITRFDPKDIQANPVPPKIDITSFQRLNKVVPISEVLNVEGQIEIVYTDYLIGFEFAALDYTSPLDNQYMYKLVGFDKDWIQVRDVRRAIYTNLPSGTYTFKVIASNSDGKWNNEGKTITLIVHPAPWFSWWAYALYSLICICTIYYVHILIKRKTSFREQQKIELERIVSARTIELIDANKQLLKASITDQLTGLHNRRYLSDVISERLAAIDIRFSQGILDGEMDSVSGPRLMALMFDLDGFKPINDNYGHDAGDKVIVQVAKLLKAECRKEDIVIRWGGDEYMVVAEVKNLVEAKALAERIRLSISTHAFDVGLSSKFYLSSSLGFALYPFSHYAPHSITWDQVHLLADQALYKSKEAGRNTWFGIVQSTAEVPFNRLNALVPNLDKALENLDVQLVYRGR